MDSSLTKKEGRHLTRYGVVGYYLGEVAFSTKGALGEQAEVFDAEMAGLSAAGEATKQFILNGEWAQQPTHIVFYADNSAAIACIHKGSPGKAQEHLLAFRNHITEVLNKVKDSPIPISYVPAHFNIRENKN